MHKHKIIKFISIITVAGLIFIAGGYFQTVKASGTLQSKGKLVYQNGTEEVIIDTADHEILQEQIDEINNNIEYKRYKSVGSNPNISLDSALITSGGIQIDEYKNHISIFVDMAFTKDILPAWTLLKIGSIKDWCGISMQCQLISLGDNPKSLLLKIDSTGTIYAFTHSDIASINHWFYGTEYIPF